MTFPPMFHGRRLSGALLIGVLTLVLAPISLGDTAPLGDNAPLELEPIPWPPLEGMEPAVVKQLTEARERLSAAIENPAGADEGLADTYGGVAQLYHTYELWAPGEACYRNAQKLAPESVRWPHLLGNLYHRSGKLDEALVQFERAVELRADDTPAMIYMAQIHLAKERPDVARTWVEQVLELEPNNTAALAIRAELDLAAGEYAKAAHLLEQLLQAVPDANRLHYPLGLAYRGLGDMDKAREHLEARGEVGIRPRDQLVDGLEALEVGERVFLLRGRQAFRAQRYEEAAQAFAQAVEAAPESARARVNLGTAFAALQKNAEAIEQFRAALAREPNSGTAHFNLGSLLLAENPGLAFEHFKAAVLANPSDISARLQLANLLRRAGQPEEALSQFQRVVELDPSQEAAQFGLAASFTELQRYDDAATALEAAVNALPSASRLIHALAKLRAAAPDAAVRNGAQAVELAKGVWKAAPTQGHAETLAMAFAEAGQCENAEALQRVVILQAEDSANEAGMAALGRTLESYQQSPCRPPIQVQ